jgi:hypothetical protein
VAVGDSVTSRSADPRPVTVRARGAVVLGPSVDAPASADAAESTFATSACARPRYSHQRRSGATRKRGRKCPFPRAESAFIPSASTWQRWPRSSRVSRPVTPASRYCNGSGADPRILSYL